VWESMGDTAPKGGREGWVQGPCQSRSTSLMQLPETITNTQNKAQNQIPVPGLGHAGGRGRVTFLFVQVGDQSL